MNDKEHANLLELVSTIHGSKAIQELITEGEQVLGSDNNALQQAWHQDVTERLEYEMDQKRSGMNMGIVIGEREKQERTDRERKGRRENFTCGLRHNVNFFAVVSKSRGNKWNQITVRMGK